MECVKSAQKNTINVTFRTHKMNIILSSGAQDMQQQLGVYCIIEADDLLRVIDNTFLIKNITNIIEYDESTDEHIQYSKTDSSFV
jgi:hypothetical protein